MKFTFEQLENRAMCAAHTSTVDLTTGLWQNDGSFQELDKIYTGDAFELSGCGLIATAENGQGGGSRWSANPNPNYEYLYSVELDGCIQQGGSSTYIAPDKPGWYSIELYAWDDVSPYDEISEGILWIHVKKSP